MERKTSKATYKSVSKPNIKLNPKRDSRERQHAPHALPKREGRTSVHFKSKFPSLVCRSVKCRSCQFLARLPPCFTESGPQRSANCVGTPRCVLLTLWLTVVPGGRACTVSLLLRFPYIARFSPDDKFSKERITLKKRFGLLLTQTPRPPH